MTCTTSCTRRWVTGHEQCRMTRKSAPRVREVSSLAMDLSPATYAPCQSLLANHNDCRRTRASAHQRPARQAEGEKKPRRVRVDAFPRGTVLMNELMGRLLDAARCVPALREKLYQANFHTTLSGQAMVRYPGRACRRMNSSQRGSMNMIRACEIAENDQLQATCLPECRRRNQLLTRWCDCPRSR